MRIKNRRTGSETFVSRDVWDKKFSKTSFARNFIVMSYDETEYVGLESINKNISEGE
jgi:hypothetical protein